MAEARRVEQRGQVSVLSACAPLTLPRSYPICLRLAFTAMDTAAGTGPRHITVVFDILGRSIDFSKSRYKCFLKAARG